MCVCVRERERETDRQTDRPELALGVGERLAEPLHALLDLRILALFLLASRLQQSGFETKKSGFEIDWEARVLRSSSAQKLRGRGCSFILKADGLLYHSNLGLGVIEKKKKVELDLRILQLIMCASRLLSYPNSRLVVLNVDNP